jgi:hypothetical protein
MGRDTRKAHTLEGNMMISAGKVTRALGEERRMPAAVAEEQRHAAAKSGVSAVEWEMGMALAHLAEAQRVVLAEAAVRERKSLAEA